MTPCKFHDVPKCRPGFPFDKKRDCRKCWYLAHGIRPAGLSVPVQKIVDCPRFGEATGEERPCLDGCAKGTAIKLFACSLHTVCTPKKRVDGAQCCERCPDRPTSTIRKIIVRNRAEVNAIRPAEPYVVVSIYDYAGSPALITPASGLQGVLPVRFQDFDPSPDVDPGEQYNGVLKSEQWMKTGHAEKIWEFLRSNKVSTVVVHCNEGVSRSPAVAMAIADAFNLPRSVIDWKNKHGTPDPAGPVTNQHVYRTMMDCRPGAPAAPTIPLPLSVRTIDSKPLKLGRVGEAFNSSLIRFKGRLLLCYRTGWAGARLHVAELDNDMIPQKVTTLNHLGHPRASVGQEDPRLFEFQGKLHVSFTGVERVNGAISTNVLYARLTDDFRVEEVFAPVYYGRRKWEKNWTFFEWEGVLLAVYSIAPHVLLHIRGNQAYPFAETRTELPWSGGHLRGGCPPIRVGDTFYHWFHGRRNEFGEAGRWLHGVYTVGVYTFPAKWPFAIDRMTPKPIWEGNYETLPDDQKRAGNPAVVFPAGAVRESDRWSVSMGVHDRWTDVATWDAAAVDAMLGIRQAG